MTPNRAPPDPSAAVNVAVLLQLQDRNNSSSVAKERLSNSFAFDSFVRKRGGRKQKEKKYAGWFFEGGSFATFELCCVRPWTIRSLQLENWVNVACACDETRPWSIAKTCSQYARSERACRRFWNETWNFQGGSLATVNPPPPPPPVYAPGARPFQRPSHPYV